MSVVSWRFFCTHFETAANASLAGVCLLLLSCGATQTSPLDSNSTHLPVCSSNATNQVEPTGCQAPIPIHEPEEGENTALELEPLPEPQSLSEYSSFDVTEQDYLAVLDAEALTILQGQTEIPLPDPGDDLYLVPYEPAHIISGYYDMRKSGRHKGLDIAEMGPDAGIGTPIYAIGRSKITRVGRCEEDPVRFGKPLKHRRTTVRGKRRLPTSAEIDGYGRVYFFTRNYGQWHSGNIIITELLEGPLAGYTVRYMHLGAIRPDLEAGDVVQAGEEIGLMGGTAVQDSIPHLHIDLATPKGNRINLAPYLDFDSAAKTLEELENDDVPGCQKPKDIEWKG